MALTGANTFCKFVKQFSFTKDNVAYWATLPRIKPGPNTPVFKGI
jgi:hypothetical protein